MRFPLRRVLLGFAVGAAAGWAGGLLRRPSSAPEGSSADEAMKLPQEEFGTPAGTEPAVEGADELAQEPTAPVEAAFEAEPAVAAPEPQAAAEERPPPRKATAPAVRRPPGSKRKPIGGNDGASEPATAPEAGAEQTAPEAGAEQTAPEQSEPEQAAPIKPARRRRAATKPADPHTDAAAALREGHAEATERLADAEATATPPPEDPGPARRRRRPPAGT